MIAAEQSETFRQSLVSHAFPLGANCYAQQGRMFAEGLLHVATDLCERDAAIEISFYPSDWMITPPQVIANVDWLQPRGSMDLRKCADWHRYPNCELCWTRPDWWHKRIAEDPENVDRMSALLVKDVTVLLGYHLLADSLGLKEWQPQWPFYRHGSYNGG